MDALVPDVLTTILHRYATMYTPLIGLACTSWRTLLSKQQPQFQSTSYVRDVAGHLGNLQMLQWILLNPLTSPHDRNTTVGDISGYLRDKLAQCAARKGRADVLNWIIGSGDCALNAGNRFSYRAYAVAAARGGHVDIVSHLFETYGGMYISPADADDSFIGAACRGGHINVLEYIWQYVNSEPYTLALIRSERVKRSQFSYAVCIAAAMAGQPCVIEHFLCLEWGYTPSYNEWGEFVYRAAYHRHADVVALCLRRCTDVSMGRAFAIAVCNGAYDIAKMLYQHNRTGCFLGLCVFMCVTYQSVGGVLFLQRELGIPRQELQACATPDSVEETRNFLTRAEQVIYL